MSHTYVVVCTVPIGFWLERVQDDRRPAMPTVDMGDDDRRRGRFDAKAKDGSTVADHDALHDVTLFSSCVGGIDTDMEWRQECILDMGKGNDLPSR
jgi:hypothetical protein